MNTRILLTTAVLAAALTAPLTANAGAEATVVDRGVAATPLAASPVTVKPGDTSALAQQVNQLFTERCSGCHKVGAEQEESPHFVGNLAALIESGDIDLKQPEESNLYRLLLSGREPMTTRAEKKARHKAVPFTPEENALVRDWIQAGAPAAIAAAEDAKPPVLAPTPPSRSAETAGRKVVREAVALAAALQDLLGLPPEEQPDVRYLSLAALHNNPAEISDADLKLASDGATKLLNGLSANPQALAFPPIGPEGVLRRIRLKDLGWSSELWDRITATYPYAIDSAGLSALASSAHCPLPLVRADWFAAVASRPPFYDEILRIPKNAAELEARLGIDVTRNLTAGDAIRSGFTHSGISPQNRLVERHEIKAYPGAYWKSYDFKDDTGRDRLADFPLGPESAGLLGGAHAFAHAGGEIIFHLQNGFQAYMLVNKNGERLDGPAPIEIISDRRDKTHSAQVSNGLSCIACHDKGMIALPPDELRATAGGARFSPEEGRLIERLFPPEDQISKVVKDDGEGFQTALRQAGLPEKGPREPLISLVSFFERDVTLAQAAADLGLEKTELDSKLEAAGASLFDDSIALRGSGIPRVAFVEPFTRIAIRLGIGGVGNAASPPARTAIELTTNKAAYRQGELMVVTVQTSEDAFIQLSYQDAEGKVKILLPNAAHDGHIKGGQPVVFGDEHFIDPATGKAFRLRVGPPYGEETLTVEVRKTPFGVSEAKSHGVEVEIVPSERRRRIDIGAKPRGVDVEIVDAVRNRTRDERLGEARVKVITSE